ncbi:hypothetical protein [Micromonospora sp. 4G55]|uniref:hypothetical protein n=1 Tax=Micromonospora sp. 4G55 TaxID=2806102 RepID=UPI001A5B63CF|nr:hypothetical protein [Micromonospora sp. 4G55]MBM0260727.1 hypothetical protein [Micromonospora sp. 4G55]
METAVIYIPSDVDYDQVAARCLAHVTESGYHLDSIVQGRWTDVRRLMWSGKVDVVVVDEEGHLPARRSPRVEIAANGRRRVAGPVAGRRRRPRIIR